LEATAKLMREEGYAAVSSRRVAKEAGVTGALVHYYFPTLDDLFLELFRVGAERNLARHEKLLASDHPLTALWNWSLEPSGAELLTEFMALAHHRPAIAAEIAAYSARWHKLNVDSLAARMAELGIDATEAPAEVVLLLIGSVARTLVVEESIGFTDGHAATQEFMRRWFDRLGG